LNTTNQLIKKLIDYLPRYAEEEGYHFSVSRTDLINQLQEIPDVDSTTATTTIELCECLLDTLAVLDAEYLVRGDWCFISFPAQLLATSVLVALSDPQSRIFSPQFWNTQGISIDRKNHQRDCLNALELARVQHHESQSAPPVRYIYVSWGIIKLNDRILFYQREDTQKRYDKKSGDYGLTGGRVNQNDVPETDRRSALQALQSSHSDRIKKALPLTLRRELLEETGLQFNHHYNFSHWRSLKPYRQVQGAAPNHAFTEYYIDIYHIDLTLDGYLSLNKKVETDERLIWARLDEIVNEQTLDGKLLYIKALHEDFGKKTPSLIHALTDIPDSFQQNYLFHKEKYGITFPVDDKQVMAGVLGKEKPVDSELDHDQKKLLLGLAAHSRGFELTQLQPGIVLHPHGWVELENPGLQTRLARLAVLPGDSGLKIENHCDRIFRLSVDPELIFMDEALFTFSVCKKDMSSTKTKIPVHILRQSFETALGLVKAETETFYLTLEHVTNLQAIETGTFLSDNEKAVKIEDAYKKGLHKEARFTKLGLRNLVRREAGIIRFVVRYECI
jgi:8-oxo-dGTP pyrophosphatase MutT (NUDIX family)